MQYVPFRQWPHKVIIFARNMNFKVVMYFANQSSLLSLKLINIFSKGLIYYFKEIKHI